MPPTDVSCTRVRVLAVYDVDVNVTAKLVLATTIPACCPLHTLTVCVVFCSLPGSRTERALNESFYRMLPELLRFSSASRLLEHIPDQTQRAHHGDAVAVAVAPTVSPPSDPQPPDANLASSDDEDVYGDDLLDGLGL